MEQNARPANTCNIISDTVEQAVKLANADSVIGKPLLEGDTKVYPISDISAGFAGGMTTVTGKKIKQASLPAGAGGRVNVKPRAFLVIENDGRISVKGIPDAQAANDGGVLSGIVDIVKNITDKKKK